MSYRPPSPDYRSRRYSPSREVSGSPPVSRQNPRFSDRPLPRDYHPRHEYSPPRRRYSPSPPRGYHPRDRSPLRRYSPPPGRYDRSPPRRPYPPSAQYYRSPPRRPRSRSPVGFRRQEPPLASMSGYERDDYAARGRVQATQRASPPRGMAADREELRPPPVAPVPTGAWERGRDINEIPVPISTYHNPKAGPSKKTQHPPVRASEKVIFIGIDDEIDEDDLMGYLRTYHQAIVDSVRIVRKPSADPTRPKNIAFVTFASLAGAEDFIDNNSPAFVMPALYTRSEPQRVRIDFADPPVSHIPKQSARIPHDGMRDVGPMGGGNRVLVLRQLDAGTSGDAVIKRVSEEIARLLSKVGREKVAVQAIHRVVSIVDKVEGQSWGICFIELESPELATALLTHLISPQAQPSGFRISAIPVAASFASTSSFLPAAEQAGEHLIPSAKTGGIGSTLADQPNGAWCAYWHAQGGAVQIVPGRDAPVDTLSAQLREFLGHLAGAPAPAVTVNPTAMAGMIPIKNGKKKKEEPMMVAITTRNVLENEEVVEDKDSQLLSRTKGTNIVLPQSGRKTANNINKWNTKQTELAKPVAPVKIISEANSVIATPVTIEDYTDLTLEKPACLLCQRQFKTEEELRKHVAGSKLHKARFFFRRQRKATALTEYRDRAAERRKAFNQPDRPGWMELHPEKKRKHAEGPSAPALPEPTVEPGKDESNVGNQLLAKMGWKSGTGLGAEGAGRVEPIKVQQFAERAGLGASQGHAAGTWTGAGGRAQQAHDVSKARYNASGRS